MAIETTTTQGSAETHAGDLARDMEGLAERTKAYASQCATTVMNTARSEVESRIDQRKHLAADQIERFAGAASAAARELEASELAPVSDYASVLASRAANLASGVREKDLQSAVDDVEGFARRQPLLFVGAAALIGFGVARFLKATSHEPNVEASKPSTDTPPQPVPVSVPGTAPQPKTYSDLN